MEKKLKQLFEYQKFEKNPKIEAWLNELETKYEPDLLSDEALSFAIGGSKEEEIKDENIKKGEIK